MDRSFGVPTPVRHSVSAARLWMIWAALACGFGLSGCVEDAAQAPVAAMPSSSDNITPRPGVSPSGATLAVASISGAPGGLDDRFQAMLTAYAKRGGISIADAGQPNYLVRGYLSADSEGDAATLVSYVLDVFDAGKHRTQRVENEVVLRGTAPDPWSLVNDDVLATVAQKSAADLAAVMTNTPEAIAASTPATAPTQQVADGAPPPAQDGRTVVAASGPAAATTPTGAPASAVAPASNGYGMTAQR
ncbi:MAG: hypothetical protein WDN02_03675 [Methylovirgula sp.]|uniref:hypothetical protein n=1 Tax=Methylovirgula sp. TaxID=1978224 RepID=UPI0030760852